LVSNSIEKIDQSAWDCGCSEKGRKKDYLKKALGEITTMVALEKKTK